MENSKFTYPCQLGYDIYMSCQEVGYVDEYFEPKKERKRNSMKYVVRKESGMTYWYECPQCGNREIQGRYGNQFYYCPYCGTELDWDIFE